MRALILSLVLIPSLILSDQKEVKKIFADYTEFDRRTNTTYFYGNVKVEFVNGYLFCDKAVYNRPKEWLLCESNVYCVMVSTTDNSKLEVRCSKLKYDVLENKINFYDNVETFYSKPEQSTDFETIKLTSDELQLDFSQELLCATGEVLAETENAKIKCSKALYKLKQGVLLLNEGLTLPHQITITSLTEKYRFKNCKSNTAKINFNEEQIWLKGNVEIVF